MTASLQAGPRLRAILFLLAALMVTPDTAGAQVVARARIGPVRQITIQRQRNQGYRITDLARSRSPHDIGTRRSLLESSPFVSASNRASAIDEVVRGIRGTTGEEANGQRVHLRFEGDDWSDLDIQLFAKNIELAAGGDLIVASRKAKEPARDEAKRSQEELRMPTPLRLDLWFDKLTPESQVDFSRVSVEAVGTSQVERDGDTWDVYELRTRVPSRQYSFLKIPVNIWIRIKASALWELIQKYARPGQPSSSVPAVEAVRQTAELSLLTMEPDASLLEAAAKLKSDLKKTFSKHYLRSVEMRMQVGDVILVLVPIGGPDGSASDHRGG
jgi:hypothetical protein